MLHSSFRLHCCAKAMHAGELCVYPTEAVWGLGCDPFNVDAVFKLLELKGRSVEKGLILIAANTEQLDFLLCELSASDQAKINASWPGPTTWLVPHQNKVPDFIHGRHSTVAVRVSDHPVVQALCEAFGGPLVSTSANPSGVPAQKDIIKVRKYFRNNAYVVCPGRVGSLASPTKIIDLQTGCVQRA